MNEKKEVICIENVSFQYKGNQDVNKLNAFNLLANVGEVVALCGVSGCGKTTITRLINGIIPHFFEGNYSGVTKICGKKVSEMPLYKTSAFVGSVFQNPCSQFFTLNTTSELAFGCENLGWPSEKVEMAMEKIVKKSHIENLLNRNMFALSGGEKQQVACACAAMIAPKVIVLDEPSSNLDFEAIYTLYKQILFWKKEGYTVIIAEHRLFYLKEVGDRIIYISEGEIKKEFTSKEFENLSEEEIRSLGLRAFSYEQIEEQEKSGISCLPVKKRIEIDGLQYAHKKSKPCLMILHTEIPQGQIVAIIGKNGSEKSTFARCLCGLEKKCNGTMTIDNIRYSSKQRLKEVYMVMQDVNHQLFTESVLEEILLSMDEPIQEKAEKIMRELGIFQLKDRHPASLSGGQKQRVALASAIASRRKVLVLDEPTSGLDFLHMQMTAEALKKFKNTENTIIIITHDPEFVIQCCDFVIKMEKGKMEEAYLLNDEGKKKMLDFFFQLF